MTENKPLISLGVPVFNGEDYLQEALDSLLAQSYTNLEINICDNASSDRTEEICRLYCAKDRRIHYHRNSRNLGLLPNWRRTLDLASGDYFMWAAHDDYWSSNYLETLLECLLSHPNAVLAAGETVFVDGTGSIRREMEPDYAPERVFKGHFRTAEGLLLQHATNWLHGLYRREILLQSCRTFFTEDPWGSDVLFLLEVCLSHEVVGSNRAVMYKRYLGAQQSGPKTPRDRVKWQCWFARALLRVIARSSLPLNEKMAVTRTYFRYLRWLYFRHGLYSWTELWLRAGYQCLRESSVLYKKAS
jgi:glycosyltransferase involved in cell wall biosynthesis